MYSHIVKCDAAGVQKEKRKTLTQQTLPFNLTINQSFNPKLAPSRTSAPKCLHFRGFSSTFYAGCLTLLRMKLEALTVQQENQKYMSDSEELCESLRGDCIHA